MTKTESISPEVIKEITELQTKSSQLVHTIGEIHIRAREISAEQIRLDTNRVSIETEFDATSARFNEIMSELGKKYQNGNIDLKSGVVTFEAAE